MTPQELIDRSRSDLDDTGGDSVTSTGAKAYLWSDEDFIRYLNAAIDEACERALLVEDRSTAACCTINLVAGQAEYPLHKSVIRVKRVAWGRDVLAVTSTEELDDQRFGWETMEGRPEAYIEQSTQSIRLSRIPRAQDVAATPTLQLVVYRTLLTPLTPESNLDAELPDIKPIYQLRLLPWVYHLAYNKRDSEAFDPVESKEFEAEFTRNFGARPDANVQRKRRDRRPPVVRMRF